MRRSTIQGAGAVPFVALDEASEQPLHEQLYAALRDHVVHGRLRAGARVASSRALAGHLGISRFTVVTAFDALLAEGYFTASARGGTFVSGTLPDLSVTSRKEAARAAPRRQTPGAPGGTVPDLSARGGVVAGIGITGPRASPDGPRPFHPRRPPLDTFPVSIWSRLVRRQWRTRTGQMLDYGDPGGLAGLREAIAEHAASTRGLDCSPEQVIITAGAQQAFNLVFQLLLDPGDSAWIEEPGYLDARGALAACGARVIPVPVDAQGIDVDAGMAAAPRARLAYVSPSHQYPTGATMSASRRIQLLQWAHRARAWIVEDDYDSYFRYRGRPLPALQRLEADRPALADARVIYVGTFSKTMFPSLRLGYCVVPPSLVSSFANARAIADRNSSLSDQAALEMFIREGHYDRHLRRVRAACLERYESIMHSASRHLSGLVELSPMNAGTHVLGWLAPGLPSATAIQRSALDSGLVVFPLSRYCIHRPAHDGLVLGYGGSTPRAIDGAVRRLAKLLGSAG